VDTSADRKALSESVIALPEHADAQREHVNTVLEDIVTLPEHIHAKKR